MDLKDRTISNIKNTIDRKQLVGKTVSFNKKRAYGGSLIVGLDCQTNSIISDNGVKTPIVNLDVVTVLWVQKQIHSNSFKVK